MPTIRIALCQLNPVVGALEANSDRILESLSRAHDDGCDVAVFGELAVCGYPPEDLVLKAGFMADCLKQLNRIAAATTSCAAVVGFPELGPDGERYNSAAVLQGGEITSIYRKQLLPSYAVFDEHRWFTQGQSDQPLIKLGDGVSCGISICEDVWKPDGPAVAQGKAGAEVIININGSPFRGGKLAHRESMLGERAVSAGAPIVYVNQVGGQDELVFDGGSMVVAADGDKVVALPQFVEAYEVIDLDCPSGKARTPAGESAPITEPLGGEGELWEALVLGTRDYVTKNGFTDVVIGLSGGIDSTLVAAIAVDALGPARVHGVMMPSRYSSGGSVSDAELLCNNLGMEGRIIEIEPAHQAFEEMLSASFEGVSPDLTEENLQSRIRGVTLMALSNKFGWMVLTTGNKSESAVGYSTLYGDTAGGLAVIKDLYKLTVYDLCRWRNKVAGREIIPVSVIEKAPSAELRPDQRDDQSLPPYEILDPLLAGYIDDDLTVAELVALGHDEALVRRICRLVDLSEYKRRQTPLGLRLSTKAFGRDRRLPITNRYS